MIAHERIPKLKHTMLFNETKHGSLSCGRDAPQASGRENGMERGDPVQCPLTAWKGLVRHSLDLEKGSKDWCVVARW